MKRKSGNDKTETWDCHHSPCCIVKGRLGVMGLVMGYPIAVSGLVML